MPIDNIERSIKRGSGELEGITLTEMVLEGYGPSGAAVLVEALTDNRNRTLQDIRNIFSRGGGSLGESGSVTWLFDLRGLIIVETKDTDTEELALQAIDAGAEDVTPGDGYVEIYTKPDELEEVRKALEQKNIQVASAGLSKMPKTPLELEEKAALQTLKMLHKLEEQDETQSVSSNVNFPDAILKKYQEQV
jgi:YebC/PmpR family DNA-binding regulatory protein